MNYIQAIDAHYPNGAVNMTPAQMQASGTPIKDAWEARMAQIDNTVRYTDKDLDRLAKGDYVCVKTPYSQYFGFLKSKGRVNVVVECPYVPRPDCDYDCIQDLKFPVALVKIFCKPAQPTATTK